MAAPHFEPGRKQPRPHRTRQFNARNDSVIQGLPECVVRCFVSETTGRFVALAKYVIVQTRGPFSTLDGVLFANLPIAGHETVAYVAMSYTKPLIELTVERVQFRSVGRSPKI